MYGSSHKNSYRPAHRFLAEAATTFFDIDFDAISEADMISDSRLGELLKSATASLADGDFHRSLERCCDAVELIDEMMIKAVPLSPRQSAPRVDSQGMARLFEWTAKQVMSMERALTLHVIGGEPNEYWMLKAMMPSKSPAGTYQFVRSGMSPLVNADSVRETLRIAIHLALKIEAASDRFARMGKVFTYGIPCK